MNQQESPGLLGQVVIDAVELIRLRRDRNELLAVAENVLIALRYPRGSEAQVRCLEEVGQDAEVALAKAKGA